MGHTRQPLVLVLRVQLEDVVAGKVVLDEAPELLLVSSGRRNDELNHI